MARFMGRGTKTGLPNSLIRSFKWQHTMDARKKIKERLYLNKERRDKDIFDYQTQEIFKENSTKSV